MRKDVTVAGAIGALLGGGGATLVDVASHFKGECESAGMGDDSCSARTVSLHTGVIQVAAAIAIGAITLALLYLVAYWLFGKALGAR